jgi:L,D-transpeptidase ErfK/SrfK
LAVLVLAAGSVRAEQPAAKATPSVPVWHAISGDRFQYEVDDDDTSRSIAARFGEPDTMILLNGGEPEPGTTIVVDNRHVAAAVIPDGVVINVPQRMLFVFDGGKLTAAWPVTVGRPDWPTPLGSFYVVSMQTNPTWHVPPAIREEMVVDGIDRATWLSPDPRTRWATAGLAWTTVVSGFMAPIVR